MSARPWPGSIASMSGQQAPAHWRGVEEAVAQAGAVGRPAARAERQRAVAALEAAAVARRELPVRPDDEDRGGGGGAVQRVAGAEQPGEPPRRDRRGAERDPHREVGEQEERRRAVAAVPHAVQGDARRTGIVAGTIIATVMSVHVDRRGACTLIPETAPRRAPPTPRRRARPTATPAAARRRAAPRARRWRATPPSLLHEEADAADPHGRHRERARGLVLDADRRERHVQVLGIPVALLGERRDERRDVEDVAQAVRRLLAIVVVVRRGGLDAEERQRAREVRAVGIRRLALGQVDVDAVEQAGLRVALDVLDVEVDVAAAGRGSPRCGSRGRSAG